jgi:uncharacterized membrane protein
MALMLLTAERRRMPGHDAFAAVVRNAIQRKVMIPGAIIQGITGVILIPLGGFDLTKPDSRWLISSIVLYLIAMAVVLAVQAPAAARVVTLTTDVAADAAPTAEAELTTLERRLARSGMLFSVIVVVIAVLMATRPSV